MDVVDAVLSKCGCSEADLGTARCEQLEKVQALAGAKVIDLFKCIDAPTKVGNEVYESALSKIQKLLAIMKAAEEFCRIKKGSRAYSAFSLPGGHGNHCGSPNYDELHAQYLACCSPSTRVGYLGD